MEIDTLTIASNLATVISSLLSLFALFYAILSFKKQTHLIFFSEYTKRYNEIIFNMPSNIFDENFNLNGLEPREKEQLIKLFRSYFNLCSEEYFLYKTNILSKKVWIEWEGGIIANLKTTSFISAWNILENEFKTKYYKNFTVYIEKIIKTK